MRLLLFAATLLLQAAPATTPTLPTQRWILDMQAKNLDDILALIFKRFHAVVGALLQPVHAPWHFVISSIVPSIAHFAGSGPLKELLIKELGDSYEK